MRRNPAIGAFLLVAPLVAGCARSDDLLPTFATAAPGRAALSESLPPESALAALPREAGAVVSVTERRSTTGLRQTITLTGDADGRGEDRIEVATSERSPKTPRPVVDTAAIEEEMAEALPGVAMSFSPRVITTAGGPLGVATGRRADGGACVYAWAQNRVDRRGSSANDTLAIALGTAELTDMSLRIRLCRRGVSEERLVALVEGLSLRRDVAVRSPVGAPTGRVGRDALESAGYGGTVALAPTAPATSWAPAPAARSWDLAEPVVAPIAPAPRARGAVVAAPAPVVAAPPPVARTFAPAIPAPTGTAPAPVTIAPPAPLAAAPAAPQPAAPAIVAAPIPLPSGG